MTKGTRRVALTELTFSAGSSVLKSPAIAISRRDFRKPRTPAVRGFRHSREVVTLNLDARLPAYLAARIAGVTKQTFNYWRTSGKLARGDDGLYRLGDVLAVERDTRNNPNSRRGARRPADGSDSWAARDRKPSSELTRAG